MQTLQTTTSNTASGHDITFQADTKQGDVAILMRAAMGIWPRGWVELARYGQARSLHHAWVLYYPLECDFYVFKDKYVHTTWNEHGITPRNVHKMMCVSVLPDRMSFIIDEPNGRMDSMVMQMMETLRVAHEYMKRPRHQFGGRREGLDRWI